MRESKRIRRAFENCQLKTIEFIPYQRTPHSSIYYSATLHCPRTEDDKVEVTSNHQIGYREGAVTDLARVACATVCNSCPFIGMTEVEVTIYRADLAKAEAERLYAYRALELARAEIQQVDSSIAGTPQLDMGIQVNSADDLEVQ